MPKFISKAENVIFLPPSKAAEWNLNTSGYNKQARKCTTIGTSLHPDPIFMTALESPWKIGLMAIPAGALTGVSLARETEVISKSDIFPKQVKYPNRNLKEIKLKVSPRQLESVQHLFFACEFPAWQITWCNLWADLAAFMSVNATASGAKLMWQ